MELLSRGIRRARTAHAARAAALALAVASAGCAAHSLKLTPAARSATWSAEGGGNARTFSDSLGAALPLEAVWRVELARGITGPPAVADGIGVVATVDRKVRAVDLVTGRVLWSRTLRVGFGGGPVIGAGRVFAAGENLGGELLCLSLSSGKIVWSKRPGDVTASLALWGDSLVVPIRSGVLLLVNASDGGPLWHAKTKARILGPPALTDSLAVVADDEGNVEAFRRTDGSSAWSATLGQPVYGGVSAAGNTGVVAGVGGKIVALDLSTGRILWSADAERKVTGSVAIEGSAAYLGTVDGHVLGFALEDGDRVLDQATGTLLQAGPAVAGAYLFFGTLDGDVFALSRLDGERKWTSHVEAAVTAPPVVTGRNLLVADEGGGLTLFRGGVR